MKLPGRSGIVAAKTASRASPRSAALCDEAEPVEVHVRAAQDGDEIAAGDPSLGDVALRAGDAEGCGRLDDRAGVLEDLLHRRAQLVGVDEDHLVDVAAGEPEGLDADLLDRDAVREQPDVGERDAAPRRSDRSIAFASSGSTPTIRISGRRRFT